MQPMRVWVLKDGFTEHSQVKLILCDLVLGLCNLIITVRESFFLDSNLPLSTQADLNSAIVNLKIVFMEKNVCKIALTGLLMIEKF